MAGVAHYEKTFGELEPTCLKAAGPDWLHDLRRQGLASFKEQGFPGLRNEDWRYTQFGAAVADTAFVPVAAAIGPDQLAPSQGLELTMLHFAGLESNCRRGRPGQWAFGHPSFPSVCEVLPRA